jgi:uncharacterized protein YecE (DUF72 family)
MELPSNLKLGTSSWSAPSWEGEFYPKGTHSENYITEYAKHFSTVEIDSTFYRIPSKAAVTGWRDRTPEGFIFASKIPQSITHEKRMVDIDEELHVFLSVMETLGEKLGPILFQFKYFKKTEIASVQQFMQVVEPTFSKLPSNFQFAVEIRNKTWITVEFLDFLRKYRIAFALIDHPWIPRIDYLIQHYDVITSNFSYIRWLGDRYKIEEQTKSWDKVIIDRTNELKGWVKALHTLTSQTDMIYGYFNNHYAGHAPASVRLFQNLWQEEPQDKSNFHGAQ